MSPFRASPLAVAIAALSVAALTRGAPAQQPELVFDFNQTGFERSSDPRSNNADPNSGEFVFCSGHWYFMAESFDEGWELWKSDGTAAGTSLVSDLVPGRDSSYPTSLICFQNELYFTASGPALGVWRTDGTTSGTTQVFAGPANELYVWGSSLVFTGLQISTSSLYFSDGSVAGTTAIQSGVWNGESYEPLPGANVLMFSAHSNASPGNELWRTDGTATGTYQVKDIRPGIWGSDVRQLTPIGNYLVFAADDGTAVGEELWRTDGTQAGTVLVKDIAAAANLGSFARLRDLHGNVAMLGNDLLFAAWSNGAGGIWRTDGTTAGTVQLPVPVGATLTDFVMDGATLYYIGKTAAAGTELFRWDGTNATLVADVHAGSASGDPEELTVLPGGVLLFTAENAATGRELYRTDGTTAGTSRVRDIWAGPGGSRPRFLTPLASGFGAIFRAGAPERHHGGVELWITDGTTAGTQMVADVNPGWQTEDAMAAPVWSSASGKLYVNATTDNQGREVWVTDGTTAGTMLLADINPGAGHSNASAFADCFDGTAIKTVFMADDGAHGKEPWITDGTPAGTRMLLDIHPTADSHPGHFTTFAGRTWFAATSPNHGTELWVTDGTTAGTQPFLDLRPGSASSRPSLQCVAGGLLYFVADDGVHGREVWVTDGTVAGTTLTRDLNPGTPQSPGQVTALGDIVVFYADTPGAGGELWRSDGTTAGTVMIADLQPGSASSWPSGFTMLQGELFFTANGAAAQGLWKTDGTTAGTVHVATSLSVLSGSLAASGDHLFFKGNGNSPTLGWELWMSDGTTAGTGLVVDLRPGWESSDPGYITAAAGGVYFRANDGVHGQEIWFSDGTAAGTALTADLDLDDHAFHGFPVLAHDGGVYFRGSGPLHGSELRVIREVATVTELGPGCGSSLPTLHATDPQLGVGSTFSGTAPTPNVTALVVGIGSGQPFTFAPVLPPECTAWIGLSQPSATVLAFGPQWSHQLTIPSSPAFTGVQFACQAVHLSTPLSLSRALQLTLGR